MCSIYEIASIMRILGAHAETYFCAIFHGVKCLAKNVFNMVILLLGFYVNSIHVNARSMYLLRSNLSSLNELLCLNNNVISSSCH